MTTAASAGWLAAVLLLANDVFVFELRVAYVDLAQAFYFLASFVFLSRAADLRSWAGPDEDPGKRSAIDAHLLLAGLAAGLVASSKVTGIVAAGILALLWLPALGRAARAGFLAREARRFLLRFGLPVLALWLPWLAKSAWYTGNPVYPFAHGLFGGPFWSAELGERFATWQRAIGMGRDAVDYLLLPLRVIVAGGRGYERFDGELTPLWLLAIPLALVFGRRYPVARRAFWVAGVYFVFWALGSQQIRFLLPILPLLALATGVGAAGLVARLRAPALRMLLGTTLIVAGLLAVAARQQPVLAAGYRSAAVYRGQGVAELKRRATPPVYFALEELAADARILMINHNRGFFVPREYLADSFFEASQLAAWLAPAGDDVDALRALLDQAGVSHLLVARRDWGIPWPPALRALLADPARVDTLYQDAEYVVLRLR